MDKFAFIVHPMEIKDLYQWQPLLKILPSKLTEKIIKWIPPFKISHIKNIRSITGKETEGYFVICTLLPHQMLNLEGDFVVSKIIAAGKIAEKLGARILGLGAYTSVIGEKGITVAKNLDIAVTTGNSYTVATVIKACLEIAAIKDIRLSQVTAAIIGATGSIGSACTEILAEHVGSLIIVAPNQQKLEKLAELITKNYFTPVEIEQDPKKAIIDADIIITATNSPFALISIEDLRQGAIVCDVATPGNIFLQGRKKRKDVVYFKGGLVKTSQKLNLGIDINLPPNIIYGCIAETIILALEERFENYSLGGKLSLDHIKEIEMLASKHGFEPFLPSDILK